MPDDFRFHAESGGRDYGYQTQSTSCGLAELTILSPSRGGQGDLLDQLPVKGH